MTEKSWFVLRYNHFPPDTAIKVGQLITNPSEPYEAIGISGPEPFPRSMQSIVASEEDFSWDKTSSSENHAALSAQMDGLPISGSISGEFKRTNRNWAEFGSLETKLIIPTKEYVEASMKREVVREFLGKSILLKSVFMITGVKIARRALRGQESTKSYGGALQLGVTRTPGIPVSLGPDVGANKSDEEKMSLRATDFVWAFSLRRIYYRRGVVKGSATYKDGSTLEQRLEETEDKREEMKVDDRDMSMASMEVDGLSDEDFTGEGSRLISVSEAQKIQDDSQLVYAEKL